MESFFKKNGPFDINLIIKKTFYSQKKIITKHKIYDVASISNARINEITFINNLKYLDDLNKTKASFCFIEEKFVKLVKNKKLKLIISSNPLLDLIVVCKLFYPDAHTDHYKFNQNSKYLDFRKSNNTLIDKSVKIGKNFLTKNTVM